MQDTNIAALQSQTEIETTISGIGSVSSELVLTYLKKIRPQQSRGPDEIHARLLRNCERELSIPLSIKFSKSLADGKIPIDWKRANVPIYKKGDRSEVGNL